MAPRNQGGNRSQGSNRSQGGNRQQPKTETRTIGRSYTNSNIPSKNFTSTSQIKVAAGTPENVIRNRVESRSADNWANAQYGNKFGKGDIGRLQEKGFSNNEIMKIAQLAYSQGDVRKVNRTSDALGALSSSVLNPAMPTTTVKGQTVFDPMMAGLARRGSPRTQLGWQGFGAPMTRNTRSGLGGYSPAGFWNMPTSLTTQGGFKPYSQDAKPFATTTDTGIINPTAGSGAGEEEIPTTPTTPAATIEPVTQQDTMGDSYALMGSPTMRLGKSSKKQRGIRSTAAPSTSSRSMPTSKTLGM